MLLMTIPRIMTEPPEYLLALTDAELGADHFLNTDCRDRIADLRSLREVHVLFIHELNGDRLAHKGIRCWISVDPRVAVCVISDSRERNCLMLTLDAIVRQDHLPHGACLDSESLHG